MTKKHVLTVAWPSFLVACVLEALVFVLFDPLDAHWLGQPIALTRQGVYTLSFFIFWALAAVSGSLTLWLFSTTDSRVG
jgi:hypothetical protein